jgi:hypothetical protein
MFFCRKGDVARWIRFYLQPVTLKKNTVYAFRLHSDTALVGIGEAASNAHKPFAIPDRSGKVMLTMVKGIFSNISTLLLKWK